MNMQLSERGPQLLGLPDFGYIQYTKVSHPCGTRVLTNSRLLLGGMALSHLHGQGIIDVQPKEREHHGIVEGEPGSWNQHMYAVSKQTPKTLGVSN